MVRPALLSLAVLCFSPSLGHASEALERTFAERAALLATDSRCALFEPPVRAALEAGAALARGALLRAGWSNARVNGLAGRAADLAAPRPCTDAAVAAAARSAKAGFEAYARLSQMRFPGSERVWLARRNADMQGFVAVQALGDGAQFGLRGGARGAEAAIALPVPHAGAAPATARVILRDPVRAPASRLDIPGRRVGAFAENGPQPAHAQSVLARARAVTTDDAGARTAVFSFAPEVLERMARLDPREAVIVEVDDARSQRRFLVEVGDLSAALAFLRAR